MLKVGQIAPDFSLPDQEGNMFSLSSFSGNYLLIYFYPKDDTPGCTTETCSFRDNLEKFKEQGAHIIGISADGTKSHKKFSDKHSVNFPLLSDESHEVLEKYGVWQEKSMMGRKYMGIVRSSLLINKDREVIKVYEKVNPLTHTSEVLKDLRDLSS